MAPFRFLLTFLTAITVSASAIVHRASSDTLSLAECPGYKASAVKSTRSGLTANLKLAGKACNIYGKDLTDLILEVTFETGV
jgi:alpha-glucosidase